MDERHLRRWLDQQMSAAESDAFLSSLSEAERRVARALSMVADAAVRLPSAPPPADFTARAMARVRARRPPRRTLWSWLRAPALSPLTALAGAAVVAIAVLGATEWHSRAQLSPGGAAAGRAVPAARVLARLSYRAPLAREVAVAGDFNGWAPQATRMRRAEGGVWTVEVPLSPGGRYQYMFVVDGQWVTDPGAPATVDDGFGGKNGLLDL